MAKKTRNIKRTTRAKKNTRKVMQKMINDSIFDLPMNFPISHASHKHPINTASSSSTTAMNAVYADGRWHIDTDINGEKSHTNLTNSQLMKLLSHPASKKDLRTLLEFKFDENLKSKFVPYLAIDDTAQLRDLWRDVGFSLIYDPLNFSHTE